MTDIEPTYCSVNDVAGFLGVPFFDVNSTPSDSTVKSRILEAEELIDDMTNASWRGAQVLNEIHNATSNYQRTKSYHSIYLNHRKILPLTSASGDKLEIFDGNNWVDWIASGSGKVEGRANDFWVDYSQGVIYVLNGTILPKGVRVSYRYGDSAKVPASVKKAAIYLVCIDLLASDDRTTLLPEGSSQMDHGEKIAYWRKEVDSLLERFKEISVPFD